MLRTLGAQSGSYVDPELRKNYSDLLFSARIGDIPLFLYLLFDHQSTLDQQMPLRTLVSKTRIWKRHVKDFPYPKPLPPIVSLVVSHAPSGCTAPTSFHQLLTPDPTSIAGLATLVPSFEILIEDLSKLSNAQIKSYALAAFPEVALYLLRDARDFPTLLHNACTFAKTVLKVMRTTGVEAFAQVTKYLSQVISKSNLEEFQNAIITQCPEIEEAIMTMTAAQEWKLEGRLEGRLETLRQQLTIKFGEIPNEYQRRLQTATAEELERYTAQFVTAKTLDQVFEEAG